MDFRIADTFTDSLARLTNDEQKAVKTTAFDLQLNPTSPGMSFHKLDRVKDRNFWSVRVNQDIRLIVHRTTGSLLLCYVDHHDAAYAWAARRKLEVHPATGAAQLVEIRETVREIEVPRYVEVERAAPPKPRLFARVAEETLLAYGVPPEWMDDVRAATEDTVLELADHLPAEAAEALLEIAVGGRPKLDGLVFAMSIGDASPSAERLPHRITRTGFDHPDAQRRFRLIGDVEELKRVLEYPWEKWTIFLHPAQRASVERDHGGPARVSGSAGTGKTIVALHRGMHLARANPDARVLLTTFSPALASALRVKLRLLVSDEPGLAERLEVHALDEIALRLHERGLGPARLAAPDRVGELLEEAAREEGATRYSAHFLATEWEQVVDAWQLASWEAYRDVARLGRKTRLPESQREVLWRVFERVRAGLRERGLVTRAEVFGRLAARYAGGASPPFDFVVVDEAQDVGVAQLRFLAALAGNRPNGLFFAGDLGQRIFQQPFSWKSLGVDVRGRSRTLRINYRTSHQIRARADRLLGAELSDVDGIVEDRRGTVSVFSGPDPDIRVLPTPDAEIAAVADWLAARVAEGVLPHEIGVFVRSDAELDRATAAIERAGLESRLLDDRVESDGRRVAVGTMHLAKGLEFRAVAVMACDDEVVPLQSRIEAIADDADLEHVYDTERHLLYVACTRAREELLVTSGGVGSEFLEDLEN